MYLSIYLSRGFLQQKLYCKGRVCRWGTRDLIAKLCNTRSIHRRRTSCQTQIFDCRFASMQFCLCRQYNPPPGVPNKCSISQHQNIEYV